VKKAYRAQAQIWHPDKIAARRKQRQKQQVKREEEDKSASASAKPKRTIDVTDDGISNVSVEECTEHFAKVAEAYEVLSDYEKRYEYDLFLLDSEDQMDRERKKEEKRQQQEQRQQQQQQHHGAGYDDMRGGRTNVQQNQKRKSFFQNFKTDPLAVFEEFFFGSADEDGGYHQSNDEDDEMTDFMSGSNLYSFFSRGQDGTGKRQKQHQGRPDRTSETTHITYDPRFGKNVHRVMRREEFDEYHELHGSRVYYRIIAQEFVEEYDDRMYRQHMGNKGTNFVPVSDHYLMDEGYTTQTPPGNHGSTMGGDNTRRQQHPNDTNTRTRSPLSETSSRLEQDSYITPKSKFLLSQDKRYYAGLTPDCELVVVEELGEGDDNPVVWTTDTFVPPQYRSGVGEEVCFLALYGGQLAVMMGGDPEHPQTILWNSPDPPIMTPGSETEETVEYYASLDNDGCLAVYRKRQTGDEHDSSTDTDDGLGAADDNDTSYTLAQWWRYLLQKIAPSSSSTKDSSRPPPRTRAAAAWHSIQTRAVAFIRKTTRKQTSNTTGRSGIPHSSSNRPKDECIYASGPTGCFTPGRYVVHISKRVRRSITSTVAKLDHAVDGFVDYLAEGGEYDVDTLDTLIRVGGRAGTSIGKSAVRIAGRSVKEVKVVAQVVKHRVRVNYFRLVGENGRGRLAYTKAQAAFGDFVHFLSESGEEEEDVLDTLVRVAGKGATQMAVSGIEEAKVVAKKVQGVIVNKFVKLQSLIDTDRFGLGIGN